MTKKSIYLLVAAVILALVWVAKAMGILSLMIDGILGSEFYANIYYELFGLGAILIIASGIFKLLHKSIKLAKTLLFMGVTIIGLTYLIIQFTFKI